MLMAACVREDSDGIVFDSSHPSWKQLIKVVNDYDEKIKAGEKPAVAAAAAADGKTKDSDGWLDVKVSTIKTVRVCCYLCANCLRCCSLLARA